MLSSYLKIAYRNLFKQKVYSLINIGGLAVGMAVAMLIGLWLYDELSFNHYHQNYQRIAQVMYRETVNGKVGTGGYSPLPMGKELRTTYGEDFSQVVLSSFPREHILAYQGKKLTRTGNFLSQEAPRMLTLKMRKGTSNGLGEPASVMLSESLTEALFGSEEPLNKIIKLDNKENLKVTGVYQDLPYNSDFRDMAFIAPWSLYVSTQDWVRQAEEKGNWEDHSFQILVQLAPNTDVDKVSAKIKHVKRKHLPEYASFNAEFFLHPMQKWHLYSEWDKTGKAGGRIQYVVLFGLIGVFVLLLACINFMNLSTARSQKRAKEVGVRKTMGSLREQLITQFLSESLLVTALAFLLALVLTGMLLPHFNQLADKQMRILWSNPFFWVIGVGFSLLTGILAGSYPALYLSSFEPVKVLKGTFQAGRLAATARKALVVVQFTVSVTLIMGSLLVHEQIQHAKNRPLGYDQKGLITVAINTPELRGSYHPLRSELLKTGAVVEMATSSSPITASGGRSDGFEWEGKDPDLKENFAPIAVTHDFGKTVGWQFLRGRDFARTFITDSSGMVLNETAVKYMGLEDPVGKTIKWHEQSYQVLGVVKDMVMGSPFEPVYPTVFVLDYDWANVINIKLTPALSAQQSLQRIRTVFQKLNPGSPFDYRFSDQEYAHKFAAEERIGTLATGFTGLAVLISCLGLFGLASYMTEQRTKEIGVRKVLGASAFTLWGLLSKEFVSLVLLAFLVATPLAYYFFSAWLQQYEYRTPISWWIFAASGAGALLLTLLTVSYQSLKAAFSDPVKSLRSE